MRPARGHLSVWREGERAAPGALPMAEPPTFVPLRVDGGTLLLFWDPLSWGRDEVLAASP